MKHTYRINTKILNTLEIPEQNKFFVDLCKLVESTPRGMIRRKKVQIETYIEKVGAEAAEGSPRLHRLRFQLKVLRGLYRQHLALNR